MTGAILVVDDSLTVRMDLVDAFEAAGLRPLPCATVAEARQALATDVIALAILDVVLPDGDGVSLLSEIRSSSVSGLPVLMLSSESEVRDRIRGLKTGADEYVGKPYDRGYVVERARALLREREGDQAQARPVVLVIDDSVTFREALRHALEGAGYAVLGAASGEEGLRLAAANRPTAMLVDGVLPGLDGPTVIRRIRLDAALRGTPCLLLTASEDRDAELNALDAGADAFVRKEEQLEVILARLHAVLRRAASSGADQTESLLGPKKILAVDDSATYLHELADVLTGEGYDVVLAHSGEEALEMLAVQPVDCVLLDVIMPGLDGRETCRRIKGSPAARDIPLILLTALEEREALLDGLGTGADDYITKSSDFAVLKARVRAQLRRKQFEDENRRIRETLLRRELEATEARAAQALAETRAALVSELERKNRELEAFSYSVSHDLRAPLRGLDGFSQALLEDYAEKLDDRGQDYLRRIRAAAQRMGELIDDMLELSRVARAELRRERLDLAPIVRSVMDELRRREPERQVTLECGAPLLVDADGRLMRVVFENLLGNAWKFTSKIAEPRIDVGIAASDRGAAFFVRDNGAGFNPNYAQKLFRPFQRLHNESEFPGTGIGLATVYRVVDRHGGEVWAAGAVGQGATFYFTIPSPKGTVLGGRT